MSGLALGLDVGNAKIKLCAALPSSDRPRITTRLLPYDDRRRYRRHEDFAVGLSEALDAFLGDARREVAIAVVTMSSGYSYPTYREGVVHTMRLVHELLPHARCVALSGTGEAVEAEVIFDGALAVTSPIAFTNAMGAAHLARRLPAFGFDVETGNVVGVNGLVVDTGGSTSGLTAIVSGVVDPEARKAPETFLDHRLRHGKLTWIGAQTTPLEALASEVDVDGRTYPVIPRGVSFDNVAAVLELLSSPRTKALSLFGAVPDRTLALRAIADAVNLDADMASEEQLVDVARTFHRLAIERLSRGVTLALATMPEHSRTSAIAFGLGARSLALPALQRAGVARVVLADEHLGEATAEAASCVGPCHLGLELLTGRVRAAR